MTRVKVIRCDRCQRRCRDDGDWNVETRGGRIIRYLCPDCQTPDENEEARLRELGLLPSHVRPATGEQLYGYPPRPAPKGGDAA